MSQNGPKTTSFIKSLTKNLQPPTKQWFVWALEQLSSPIGRGARALAKKKFFRVQTRRLAASFDTSTRSVTRTGAEIFLRKATCV